MNTQSESSDPNKLTTADVASLFDVSPETVRRWVRQGKIRAESESPGGPLMFEPKEVAIFYMERSFRRYLNTPHDQE